MRIAVTKYKPEASTKGSLKEGQDYSKYYYELDYQEAVLLLESLRASPTLLTMDGPNRKAIFDLQSDGTISVEIVSAIDDFWAISEVTLVEAQSIIRIIHSGADFTDHIPETKRLWDANGPAKTHL